MVIFADRGILGESIGEISDACMAGLKIFDPRDPEAAIPIVLAVGRDLTVDNALWGFNPDPEFAVVRSETTKLVGGCILFSGEEDPGGRPVIIVSGNNPLETFLGQVDAESV